MASYQRLPTVVNNIMGYGSLHGHITRSCARTQSDSNQTTQAKESDRNRPLLFKAEEKESMLTSDNESILVPVLVLSRSTRTKIDAREQKITTGN